MSNTAEELKDTLNDIERDVYDGVDLGDMFTKAYVLADELGESIDKLSEEDEKLRELVHDLLQPVLADGFDCYGCVHEDCNGMQYTDRCKLLNRARELGVEVDDGTE